MQGPEARGGSSRRAPKLADATVTGRYVGPHQVHISWTSMASIEVLIFSAADRGAPKHRHDYYRASAYWKSNPGTICRLLAGCCTTSLLRSCRSAGFDSVN
jgi:hypothetical protein